MTDPISTVPFQMNLTRARMLLFKAMNTQGPDFVYNNGGLDGCHYIPMPQSSSPAKRTTGCLIGVALKLAGLDERDVHRIGGTITSLSQSGMAERFIVFTREALTYLQIAQQAQDSGATWGHAVKAAEAYADTIASKDSLRFAIEEED